MKNDLFDKLLNKEITREELVQLIINKPSMIPNVIEGVASEKANIRYGCANALKFVSDEKPELLYPYMDFFADLLESKYRILKWIGLATVANITPFDTKKKFDKIFDKYYSLMNDEYMVTVANVVSNSGKIAKAKPYLVPKITKELLKVNSIKTTPHLTEECKRVIAEHTIASFDIFFDKVEDKSKVLSFVNKHANSSRKTLKKSAGQFLKKWNSE